MRSLRVLLIVVVILGVLFVIVDRVAVHFAEGQVADRLRSSEHLASTPDVSIEGFPFLTQLAGGELDDVEVGIKTFEAQTGTSGRTVRIDDLHAGMKGVRFSGDYSSATADSATGTATITYDELLKAAKPEPTDIGLGITAQVVGLSDGGNGKIKVAVKVSVLPTPVSVLGSVSVKNDRLQVHADSLPRLLPQQLVDSRVREITDFQQAIDRLPGGIALDSVRAEKDGVHITVKGSHVRLAG